MRTTLHTIHKLTFFNIFIFIFKSYFRVTSFSASYFHPSGFEFQNVLLYIETSCNLFLFSRFCFLSQHFVSTFQIQHFLKLVVLIVVFSIILSFYVTADILPLPHISQSFVNMNFAVVILIFVNFVCLFFCNISSQNTISHLAYFVSRSQPNLKAFLVMPPKILIHVCCPR